MIYIYIIQPYTLISSCLPFLRSIKLRNISHSLFPSCRFYPALLLPLPLDGSNPVQSGSISQLAETTPEEIGQKVILAAPTSLAPEEVSL